MAASSTLVGLGRHSQSVRGSGSGSSPGGGSLWNGSLACSCISSQIFPYQSFVSGHAAVVPDPVTGRQNVLKFAVSDRDRPYSGDTNPRADIESPRIFKPGDDEYVSVPVLVPTSTPAVDTNTAWFSLAEIYGPPFGGSPTVSVALSDWHENGQNHFIMNQDARYGWRRAWTGPASNDGRWHTITFHVNFEPNDSGFVQIYFDGQPQTFANGTTTLHEPTLDPGVNWDGRDGNFLDLQSYRSAGSFPGTVTTYEGTPRIGPSLASVL